MQRRVKCKHLYVDTLISLRFPSSNRRADRRASKRGLDYFSRQAHDAGCSAVCLRNASDSARSAFVSSASSLQSISSSASELCLPSLRRESLGLNYDSLAGKSVSKQGRRSRLPVAIMVCLTHVIIF